MNLGTQCGVRLGVAAVEMTARKKTGMMTWSMLNLTNSMRATAGIRQAGGCYRRRGSLPPTTTKSRVRRVLRLPEDVSVSFEASELSTNGVGECVVIVINGAGVVRIHKPRIYDRPV